MLFYLTLLYKCHIKLLLFFLHTHSLDRKSSSVSEAPDYDQSMKGRSLSRSSLGSVSSEAMDLLPTSSTSSTSSDHQSPQFPGHLKHSRSPSSLSASITIQPVQFSSSDHVSLAFRSMNQMRKSGLLCDVHLVAGNGGDQIKCHKIVLAATSAYFNAMFSSKYIIILQELFPMRIIFRVTSLITLTIFI